MRRITIVVLIWLAAFASAQTGDFSGRVVGITDGDTVTVLTDAREQIRVRLAEIDAPERGQPFSSRSRELLSELVAQRTVRVRYEDTDQYGRIVGRIFVGAVDVSAEMVRAGAAWVYRDYVRDQSLFALEVEARANRRGPWGLSEFERIEPWEWRRGARPTRQAAVPSEIPAAFECGSKRYCREMASCEEAHFYLRQCAVDTLDGDGDGVPCEAICR